MQGFYSDLVAIDEAGPQPYRYDFETYDEYLITWQIWQAQSRDCHLNDEEYLVIQDVYMDQARKLESK